MRHISLIVLMLATAAQAQDGQQAMQQYQIPWSKVAEDTVTNRDPDDNDSKELLARMATVLSGQQLTPEAQARTQRLAGKYASGFTPPFSTSGLKFYSAVIILQMQEVGARLDRLEYSQDELRLQLSRANEQSAKDRETIRDLTAKLAAIEKARLPTQ